MDFKGWGPLIAVVAVPTIALLFAAGAFQRGADGTGGLIYEYQTLIGALLALAGAVVAAVWVKRQVDEARRQTLVAEVSLAGRRVVEAAEVEALVTDIADQAHHLRQMSIAALDEARIIDVGIDELLSAGWWNIRRERQASIRAANTAIRQTTTTIEERQRRLRELIASSGGVRGEEVLGVSLAATFGEFRIHLRYLELLADSLSSDRPNDGPVKPLLAWRNELNAGQDHRREQLWNALGAATRDRQRLLDRHRQLLADIER